MGVIISRKNKLPDLLNSKRSKSKTNINSDLKTNLINYIDSFRSYKLFTLKRITDNTESNVIKVRLCFNNQATSFNYMDSYIADFCTDLTNDLRDRFGHNIWFDLKNGIFYFFVTEN